MKLFAVSILIAPLAATLAIFLVLTTIVVFVQPDPVAKIDDAFEVSWTSLVWITYPATLLLGAPVFLLIERLGGKSYLPYLAVGGAISVAIGYALLSQVSFAMTAAVAGITIAWVFRALIEPRV